MLCGRVAWKGDLRYTPAGVEALDFRLGHASEQQEAGGKRRVQCEVEAVALADLARALAQVETGRAVRLTGFLANRDRFSRQLVLHAIKVEFL